MPRKSKKIAVHTVKNFGDVDIRLNPEGRFEAQVNDKDLYAQTKADLIAKIEAEVRAIMHLDWLGVIEVKGLDGSYYDQKGDSPRVEIEFGLERSWVARRADGKWIEAGWGEAARKDYTGKVVDSRAQNAHETYGRSYDAIAQGRPIRRKSERGWGHESLTVHMPYSDELWAKLRAIQQAMRELDLRLAKLLGSLDGYNRLLAGENFLPSLPAPVETDEEA